MRTPILVLLRQGRRPLNGVRMGWRREGRSKKDPLPPEAWEVGRGSPEPALRPPAARSTVPLPGWMKGCLPGLPNWGALAPDSLMAASRAPETPPPPPSPARPSLPEPGFQVPAQTSQRPGRGAETALPTPARRALDHPLDHPLGRARGAGMGQQRTGAEQGWETLPGNQEGSIQRPDLGRPPTCPTTFEKTS